MAKLGQHFLTDQGALEDIVRASGAQADSRVLEIGPGRGALTKPLLATGATVVAIEADAALACALPALFKKSDRLSVIDEDFLRFDLSSLPPGPWIIAANLPYAVGTAILQKILLWEQWSTATLMFQKEVALRIVADTGGADYGLLALSTKIRADAEIAFDLSPQCFRPRPKVDSSVVLFRRLESPRVPPENEKTFWHLAKTAFSQRRKMAASVLSKALGKSRADVEGAFASVGVAPDARPEQIPFEAWAALAGRL